MKILSLTQPWATLVVLGEKNWETRSRRMGIRGHLGIHASANYPKWARDLAHTEPFMSALMRHGWHPNSLPTGAILGRVEAHETERVEVVRDQLSREECSFGNYEDGRFCTRFSEAVSFHLPIPAKGSLGVWNFTEGPHAMAGSVPWYTAVCRGCGFTASSEFFNEIRYEGDGDMGCPFCGCTSAEELKVVI